MLYHIISSLIFQKNKDKMTLCDFVSESAMDNPKYVDDFDQKKIVRYVHKNIAVCSTLIVPM